MEHTANINRTFEVITHYTCDACGKKIGPEDWEESQEMLHWRMTCGYGSIFGDGDTISLDLCQHCIKARLGDVLQIHDE